MTRRAPQALDARTRWLALLVLCSGSLMIVIDSTVVNVALPSIRQDLGFSETSIVFRKPTGAFCYSFWPTHDVSLPGQPSRPEGHGTRYRISVVGPGVTPDVVTEARDLGAYNPEVEKQQDALFMQVIAGDKFCATQR